MTVNNAFTERKLMLTVIDSLHWLGGMLIIGAIIGAWGAVNQSATPCGLSRHRGAVA